MSKQLLTGWLMSGMKHKKHHFLKSVKKKYITYCSPMRIFLSVSGHSSELSIANHSSRSTVSQLKCVSDTISSWFENHQPQKTNISTSFTFLSFKTRIKCPLGWPQPQVFRGYFFNSCNFKATSTLFGSHGYSDDKNWLDFSSIFFKFCRFRSSIPLSL